MLREDEAIRILKRDYIRNYCVLELLKQSREHEIDICGDSVFIRLLDGFFTMISSVCPEDGLKLAENLNEKDRKIYHTGDYPGDFLIKGREVKQFTDCVQLYLPDDVSVGADTDGVVALEPKWAGFIYNNYEFRHVVSEEYIEDRIRTGPALAIMVNGYPAAWCMTHDEGTMGVLEVLPEYRRLGYARKLTSALVTSLRTLGKPCVNHIVKGNTASLTMAEKVGFKYSCDVQWITFR